MGIYGKSMGNLWEMPGDFIGMVTLRCHQTWLAGKWTIEIGDFPSKTSIQREKNVISINGGIPQWMVYFMENPI